MDLRPFQLTREQVQLGAQLLDYQPFILSDDVQTGVAYDWLYGAQDSGRYVAHRDRVSDETWRRFDAANAQLRAMYDEWIDAACLHASGSESVVDVACNSGYFLQRFAQKGYRDCIGYDRLDKTEAFVYLNGILGTNTRFIHRPYDSWTHRLPGCSPADVVIASAILLHLSDPLYFLHLLAGVTRKVLFLFTRVIQSSEYLVKYEEPNAYYKGDDFPICFDNNNSISTGLLRLSLKKLGFRDVIELQPNEHWVPQQVMGDKGVYFCLK
jgi:SAM-dependent methyltransferase